MEIHPIYIATHAASSLQVPVSGQHQSCCAVVENCQRCMFFVPRPGIFSGDELAALETQGAADPAQKIALIRHLHVSNHDILQMTSFRAS